MSMELEERIEAYLEGRLEAEQAEEFERSLALPEIARVFAETMMIRELLATLPPHDPPRELIMVIEESLEHEIDGRIYTKKEKTGQKPKRAPALRAVLQGAGWSVKGPAMALCGVPRIGRRIKDAVSIRSIWGSTGRLVRSVGGFRRKRTLPWWKKALGLVG